MTTLHTLPCCILFMFISYATFVWPEILRNKVLYWSVLFCPVKESSAVHSKVRFLTVNDIHHFIISSPDPKLTGKLIG